MENTSSRTNKKNRRKTKKLKWFLWTICLLFIAVVGYYGYTIANFANGIQNDSNQSRFPGTNRPEQVSAPPKWEGKERVNILLLGGDERGLSENATPRSDTMMVASIDPVTKKAHLLSILRDTYAEIPGHGSSRVNAAFVYGGPQLAMETVSNLLGIPIQYYVYVDFQGFIKLIDAIGGVEIDVEKDMYYTSRADGPEFDINLKAGLQQLDGKKALQYARFRYDAEGDYGRTERQRKLMKAVAGKLKSTTSILKLPKILNEIEPYIETNMDLSDMWKLGNLGFEIRNETIESVQIPPRELLVETTINGASVITADKWSLQNYIQELFAEDTGEEATDGEDGASETDNHTASSAHR